MSLHKSLKRKDSLVRRRNVLSRAERIKRLKEQERWREGESSAFGLPKVRPHVVSAPARPAKRKEKAEAPAPGEAVPEGKASPAAPGAPKGKKE